MPISVCNEIWGILCKYYSFAYARDYDTDADVAGLEGAAASDVAAGAAWAWASGLVVTKRQALTKASAPVALASAIPDQINVQGGLLARTTT
jgi:hypothetical protein